MANDNDKLAEDFDGFTPGMDFDFVEIAADDDSFLNDNTPPEASASKKAEPGEEQKPPSTDEQETPPAGEQEGDKKPIEAQAGEDDDFEEVETLGEEGDEEGEKEPLEEKGTELEVDEEALGESILSYASKREDFEGYEFGEDSEKSIDGVIDAIKKAAIDIEIKKKDSVVRAELLKDLASEYGLDNESHLSVVKAQKYGVDIGQIGNINRLLKEVDFEYTTETTEKNTDLLKTSFIQKGHEPEEAGALAEAMVDRLSKDPEKYQAKIDNLKNSIITDLTAQKNSVLKEVADREKKSKDYISSRRNDLNAFYKTGKIGEIKLSSEEVRNLRKALSVKDQKITYPDGRTVAATMAQKVAHERSVEEELLLLHEKLSGKSFSEKKKENKEKSDTEKRGKFAVELNKSLSKKKKRSFYAKSNQADGKLDEEGFGEETLDVAF